MCNVNTIYLINIKIKLQLENIYKSIKMTYIINIHIIIYFSFFKCFFYIYFFLFIYFYFLLFFIIYCFLLIFYLFIYFYFIYYFFIYFFIYLLYFILLIVSLIIICFILFCFILFLFFYILYVMFFNCFFFLIENKHSLFLIMKLTISCFIHLYNYFCVHIKGGGYIFIKENLIYNFPFNLYYLFNILIFYYTIY